MGGGDNRDLVDLEDPSVPLEGLRTLQFFSFRGLEDERCNIFGFATKKPRGVPKRRFGAISHRDSHRGIEKLKVLIGAGVSQAISFWRTTDFVVTCEPKPQRFFCIQATTRLVLTLSASFLSRMYSTLC